MTTFILNPYDAVLNLGDKDDRKLFTEGCDGLKKEDYFDGKKQNYGNFAKLLEGELHDTRTMEALQIHTRWQDGGDADAAKRVPLTEGEIDIFKSNKATKEEVLRHCNLVWAETDFGTNTPKYFKAFDTAPTDTAGLNVLRNHRKQKHVMLGKKIWNSLSSNYKIEISGYKDEFIRSNEIDGCLLWDFIRRRTNPTTTVGASKLKDEIEGTKLDQFEYNVIKYNTWFVDTRDAIIKEEGCGYNEYIRSMFRAYLSSNNDEFVEAIKEERRKWIQGKSGSTYSYLDLMDLGRLTFNNLEDGSANQKVSTKGGDEGKNYLALATEIMRKMTSMTSGSPKVNDKRTEERTYQPWRFENPDNSKTKEVRGSIMKWCENDCHSRPMWCGRRNCLNRADFSAEWKKKNETKKRNEAGTENKRENNELSTSEFKIALAAMTSADDFEALKEQFGSLKD